METNECEGCKCDLIDRIAKDEEELIFILNRCCKCKRGKLPEYQGEYEDLYLKQ